MTETKQWKADGIKKAESVQRRVGRKLMDKEKDKVYDEGGKKRNNAANKAS